MGRLWPQEYVKYGSWEWSWVVPGIVPLQAHPVSPPRVHPSPTPHAASALYRCRTGQCPRLNKAVGLKSVDQLTLSTEISGFRGITEVYNLSVAGNPNDHFLIPGKE